MTLRTSDSGDPVDTDETESLCPVCLARIPARREVEGQDVFLRKRCVAHGEFRALIWRGPPSFETWRRPKVPAVPPVTFTKIDRGCPFDCGLCPDHRQRSCTVLMEVTRNCDLCCPVCYADSGTDANPDPPLDVLSAWYESVAATGRTFNLQLSGGEPTTRDDLPDIVALGRDMGFPFIQINTNGIRLARDQHYVKDLKKAGLSSVFLQFDGTEDEIYERLRGKRLLEDKRKAIEVCGEQGIGVVLVPTLVPGVNDHNMGEILRQALRWSPVVRAVHFQPMSYFGRYPRQPNDEDRITLPELMRAMESQSGGLFQAAHFRPPGCENALCSFHGNYLVLPDGGVRSLMGTFEQPCCPGQEKAEEGATKTISYVSRQWAAPLPVVPGPNASGCCSADSASCCSGETLSLDDFITRARTHTLSVSAMAFQDAWSIDLERVKDCCIHILAPNRSLIPFCVYNLTDVKGRSLYRSCIPTP